MRIFINGQAYRIRKDIITHLQGIALVILGALCHKTGADGAAAIMLIISVGLLFGKFKKEAEYAVQDGKTKTSA